ncbi:uncharacterized protein LOC114166084 isoform X2 [Vigna unguiculata]|uniref:uncharacterized protein LOC114166084 isoform X2 n=1 Tax=Vigna unguiculata TaxID=3917 RepID=UPI0010162294|nr:uncharacterized protein LOC114166084 isoform X2 [Vigna unguiculata]
MAHKPFKFNEDILEQLRNGTAKFELVSSPVPSVAAPPNNITSLFGIGNRSALFFARIGSSFSGHSPAMKKLEHFSVQKVTGDGRCLFRALVKGMAYNKGTVLNQREERENADELRMAVKEAICENGGERNLYEEALIAITVDEPLNRYCKRIVRPDFWGGESELLVLSKLCKQPIIVYIPEYELMGSPTHLLTERIGHLKRGTRCLWIVQQRPDSQRRWFWIWFHSHCGVWK